MNDISRFASVISAGNGLTRAANHKCIITPPAAILNRETVRELEFYCSQAELPPVALNLSPYKKHGYGLTSVAPVGLYFDDCTLRFYSDNKGRVIAFFHQWINLIANFNDASRSTESLEMAYRNEYIGTLLVTLYDDTGLEVIRVKFNEAYPYIIGQERLDWQDGEKIVDLPVRFAYKSWTTVE